MYESHKEWHKRRMQLENDRKALFTNAFDKVMDDKKKAKADELDWIRTKGVYERTAVADYP